MKIFMYKELMSNKHAIGILSILFLILSLIFYGKTGSIFVDFSRESYVPFELLNSKALIKDVFLIYGPWGYIFNTFLYKLYLNINMLLLEAHIISYLILIFFYFILKKYTDTKKSLIFSLIFLFISIFSNSTFSFVLPYSFSTLWGVFAIYGIYYSILYNKKPLAFLFLGLCFVSKFEYFIFALIILSIIFIKKKESFLKQSIFFWVFPLISLAFLLNSSICIQDYLNNLAYIQKMLNTNSLDSIYRSLGAFFEINYFKYNLDVLLKMILILSCSFVFYKYNFKKLSYILLFAFVLIDLNNAFNLIVFINTMLLIYFYTKKQINFNEILLFLFSLTLSSKAIFATNSVGYANFGFILLIFFFYLQATKIINKTWLLNVISIFFILNFLLNFINFIHFKKYPIKTKLGTIYITGDAVNLYKDLNNFIENNVKENENFIVLPEGLIINLIHQKDYNFYNTTFIPLDFETFGEKYLIEKIKGNKPKYVIFTPRNTIEYGAKTICADYALDFCKYIDNNYVIVKRFYNKLNILVYKLKDAK